MTVCTAQSFSRNYGNHNIDLFSNSPERMIELGLQFPQQIGLALSPSWALSNQRSFERGRCLKQIVKMPLINSSYWHGGFSSTLRRATSSGPTFVVSVTGNVRLHNAREQLVTVRFVRVVVAVVNVVTSLIILDTDWILLKRIMSWQVT